MSPSQAADVLRPDALTRAPDAERGAARLIQGTALVALGEVVALPAALAVTAFLTRRLGAVEYGAFAVALAPVAALQWTLASVLGRPAIQAMSEADDWRPVAATVTWLHLVAGLVLGALVIVAAPLAARALAAPDAVVAFRILGVDVAIFALAAAHRTAVFARGSYGRRGALTAARWGARLACTLLLVGAGWSVAGAALACVGASLVELAVARGAVRPSLRRDPRYPVSALLRAASALAAFTIAMRVLERQDLLLLSALGNSAVQAGHYAAAQTLAALPALVALPFAGVVLVELAGARRGGGESAARAAVRIAALFTPLAAAAAGAAREVVAFVFGPAFAPASDVFALLVLGAAASAMLWVSSSVLAVVGAARQAAYVAATLVPVAAVAQLFAVPRAGPLGAAAVTVAAQVTGALIALAMVARRCGGGLSAATVARTAAVSLVAYVAAAHIPAPGVLVVPKLMAVAAGSLVLLIVVGEVRHAEVRRATGLAWALVGRARTR